MLSEVNWTVLNTCFRLIWLPMTLSTFVAQISVGFGQNSTRDAIAKVKRVYGSITLLRMGGVVATQNSKKLPFEIMRCGALFTGVQKRSRRDKIATAAWDESAAAVKVFRCVALQS